MLIQFLVNPLRKETRQKMRRAQFCSHVLPAKQGCKAAAFERIQHGCSSRLVSLIRFASVRKLCGIYTGRRKANLLYMPRFALYTLFAHSARVPLCNACLLAILDICTLR